MEDYKKIDIDIAENGYIIHAKENNTIKKFTFNDIESMKKWIEENLAAVGEVERFSKALDTENKVEWNNGLTTYSFNNQVKSNV